VGLLLGLPLPVGHAQVTTSITPTTGAGDLGTVVTPAGSVHTITGGTRASTNLFHSFGLFSVGAGDIANFSNNTGLPTTNILSRVTGGSVSNIYGTIQTTGFPGAHLYLLNPAGVIFGQDAQLNVEGSFHVSTADYLKFSTGEKFFVDPTNTNSALSIAPVSAFGFLGPNPAAITVQGSTLQVPTGQTLSLVGGDITMTGGSLLAPSGQINLASVKGQPGEVLLTNSQVAFGTGLIQITQSATIDVSGAPSGAVTIRGGRLVVDNSSITANSDGLADPTTFAVDLKVTGDITLSNHASIVARGEHVGNLAIEAGESITIRDESAVRLSCLGCGPAESEIHFSTPSLTLDNGSTPNAFFFGGVFAIDGAGVTLDVGQLTMRNSQINSSTLGGSNGGGTIRITADAVSMSDSALFALVDEINQIPVLGNAGDIILTASSLSADGRSFISTATQSLGNGGAILIEVDRLVLSNGSQIQAGTDFNSTGNAGTITITAHEAMILSGTRPPPPPLSTGVITFPVETIFTFPGSGISTRTFGAGDAGRITLRTGSLTITDGAQINSGTKGAGDGGAITITASNAVSISGPGSGLFTDSLPGELLVNANNGGGFISVPITTGIGRGGDIQVNAGTITLNNGATISAKSTTDGDAGNITITASDSFVARDSFVTTEAAFADGGDITLHVAGRLVHLVNSEITAHAAGNGGNILIDPQFIIVDASQIIASAGINGGNITLIATNGIFISPDSIIDASGTLGISGSINISAPTTSLSGTLAPLPQEFLQAGSLLSARCAARLSGKSSSFVLAGRDGLPPAPGSLQPSPLSYRAAGTASASSVTLPGLQPLRNWQPSSTAVHAGCAG
jgi:filamentous hemagglutinin family protein